MELSEALERPGCAASAEWAKGLVWASRLRCMTGSWCEQARAQVHRVRNSCLQPLLGPTLPLCQHWHPCECKLTLLREPFWASNHPFAAGLTFVWLSSLAHHTVAWAPVLLEQRGIRSWGNREGRTQLAQVAVSSSCQSAKSTPLDLVVPRTVGCYGYIVLVFETVSDGSFPRRINNCFLPTSRTSLAQVSLQHWSTTLQMVLQPLCRCCPIHSHTKSVKLLMHVCRSVCAKPVFERAAFKSCGCCLELLQLVKGSSSLPLVSTNTAELLRQVSFAG